MFIKAYYSIILAKTLSFYLDSYLLHKTRQDILIAKGQLSKYAIIKLVKLES